MRTNNPKTDDNTKAVGQRVDALLVQVVTPVLRSYQIVKYV